MFRVHNDHYFFIVLRIFNKSCLVFAYSEPFLYLCPALSIACCSVLVVNTPFITGFSNSRLRFLNPLITDDDKTILGDPYPDVIWSLTNEVTIGNFDFSIMIQGSQGAEVKNIGDQYLLCLSYSNLHSNSFQRAISEQN